MRKLLILIIFLITNSVLAQIKFTAEVEKNSYAQNETIQLSFQINVDADDFVLPRIDNFKADGPFIVMETYNFNGRKGLLKTYKYFLTPKKQGVFVIKEAQMEYNGMIYKSNQVKIQITKPIPIQRNQNNQNNPYFDPFDDPFFNQNQKQAPTNLGEGVFLVAEVSNKNPYVNEPITVVYKVYFDPRTQIGNLSNIKKPKSNDFWSQFDEVNHPAVKTIYRGKTYGMWVVGTSVLYPLESGNKPIEPFSFEAEIEYPTGQIDIIGDPIYAKKRKILTSGANIINVKALPTIGKPDGFSGAVGTFDFKAVPSKTDLKAGESLDLDLSVYGTGNLKLFSLPKPVVPSGLEMYDPEHTENVKTTSIGMIGGFRDKYAIVPQYKGNYPIKSISFSYFDLKSKSYKTITSPQIIVNVLDGPDFAIVSKEPKNSVDKTKNLVSNTFAAIKQKTTLKSTESDDFLGSKLFYGLLFLPVVLIPVIVILKKRKDAEDYDIVGNKIKKSNALAKKYLSEAKKQINNKEPFYVALEKAMHNFLKAKLSIETSEMIKDKITEILLSRNATSETVKEFITLTESCELARYAPSTNTIINQDYQKAVEIISSLEKQIS
jgi:hypothetical protein